jgi:hypothetical protein
VKEEDVRNGATIMSAPPYTYSLGLEGELIIGWTMGELPNGTPIRMHLVLPAEEAGYLKKCLDAGKTIQETLAVKRPKQGAH